MSMTKSDEALLEKIRKQADVVQKKATIHEQTKKAEKAAKLEHEEAILVLHKLTGATKEDLPLTELGEADGWKKLKLKEVLQEKHALMLLKAKGWKTVGQVASFMAKKPLTEITGIGKVVAQAVMQDVTRRIQRNKVWAQNWEKQELHQ